MPREQLFLYVHACVNKRNISSSWSRRTTYGSQETGDKFGYSFNPAIHRHLTADVNYADTCTFFNKAISHLNGDTSINEFLEYLKLVTRLIFTRSPPIVLGWPYPSNISILTSMASLTVMFVDSPTTASFDVETLDANRWSSITSSFQK